MGSYSESESELAESLRLYRALAKKSPEVYNPDVATTLNNLALLYYQTERFGLAKEKLLEFVKLYEQLPEVIRRSKAKQFESAKKLLVEICEKEKTRSNGA